MSETQLKVQAFCGDTVAVPHRVAWATLPIALREVDGGNIDIALIGPDVASLEAAVSAKPRALALAVPAMTSPDQLQRLSSAGLRIYPVLRLAHIVDHAEVRSPSTGSGLVRSRLLSLSDQRSAWLEQLAALEIVLGPLQGITLLSKQDHSYSGSARTRVGLPVIWSGQTGTTVDSFELDVVGVSERIEILCGLGEIARAARVSVSTAAGERVASGIYQNGLRLFWRAIATDLSKPVNSDNPGNLLALISQIQQLAAV